jgi:hypothetical protein
MKSTLITLIVLLLSFSLNAQNFAKKGVIELGGSAGFSSITSVFNGESAENSTSVFMIEPYVGYFIMNGLELGLIPSFSTYSHGDASQTDFGIYFAPAYNFDLKSSLYPFIEGRIGYNTSSYDDGNSETEDASSGGLAWGLRGGVKVQLGNSALLNFALAYNQITMNPENWDGDRNGYNSFDVMAGFTVFLGK